MTTSRFGAVTDALISVVGTATSVTTYDGPTLSGDRPVEYVVVGGTEDPTDDSGLFDQDWNGLGAKTKQETGRVTCAVLVGSGDDVVKTARDRALVLLGLIENAVRNDPTLAGAVTSGWCHVASGRPSQHRNSQGLYVRIVFEVAYETRI